MEIHDLNWDTNEMPSSLTKVVFYHDENFINFGGLKIIWNVFSGKQLEIAQQHIIKKDRYNLKYL